MLGDRINTSFQRAFKQGLKKRARGVNVPINIAISLEWMHCSFYRSSIRFLISRFLLHSQKKIILSLKENETILNWK
jgi:hypothetical protein